MLTSDSTALRIVVDEPTRRAAERRFRVAMVLIAAVSIAGIAWSVCCVVMALFGGGLGIDTVTLLVLGAIGLLPAILPGLLAGFMWILIRDIRARFPLDSTILAVGATHVDGPGTEPIPYERVSGATVRWYAAKRPFAGPDMQRTVRLALVDASVVECNVGPFADDAEFGRVLQALETELGRRGLTLATARA